MKKLLVSSGLSLVLLILSPLATAGDRICDALNPIAQGVTIGKNVIVPENEECTVTNVTFKQNILVEEGAKLTCRRCTVRQNVEAKEGSIVDFGGNNNIDSSVHQNFKADKSAWVRICNTKIWQNLDIVEVPLFLVGSRLAAGVAGDVGGEYVKLNKCVKQRKPNQKPAENVIVHQNTKLDKSTGAIGNTTVDDDLQCQDGDVDYRSSIIVGGDDTCKPQIEGESCLVT